MRHGIAWLFGVAISASSAHADVLKVGDRAVELDVAVDRGGKPFRIAGLRGKWFVVTVGAAWCGPCKKELPIWDRLAGEMRGRITFVAISVDDEVGDGKRFHDKLGLTHMLLAYMPAESSSVAATYGSATMPSTFVVDPSGVVRWVKAGFEKSDPDGEYHAMKAQLEKLVPAKPISNPSPSPSPSPKPEPRPEPKPEPKPEPEPISPTPTPTPTPTPAPRRPVDPEPEPPKAFERGFVFDIDGGFGGNREGGALFVHGLAGLAVTPALVVGARLGGGTAATAVTRLEFAVATASAEVDVWKGFVGASAGGAVIDNHGFFVFDLRAGWIAKRFGANALALELEYIDVVGKNGVGMIGIAAALHHR